MDLLGIFVGELLINNKDLYSAIIFCLERKKKRDLSSNFVYLFIRAQRNGKRKRKTDIFRYWLTIDNEVCYF